MLNLLKKNVHALFVKQYLPESILAINGGSRILPIQGKKVWITLSNRKIFCDNPLCDRTTFAESFSFIENKAKKTYRLIESIIEFSLTQSSMSAATYLTQHIADVKKSTICNYPKKNEPTINKDNADAVCIDDFALKKRSNYGTMMINLNDGRAIDVIGSRYKGDVFAWLSQFPNLKYISRDGSLTYASAIQETHPNAHHISDRFHLVKNLKDAITQCIYKILSGRIVIPLTKEKEVMNELLSSRPSRRDKILLVKSLASQGRTTQEIRSLTGCSLQTIRKYIKIDEKDIPKNSDDKRGREHREAIEKIFAKVEKVRALHDKGYSIRQIVDKTGHTKKTKKLFIPQFQPGQGEVVISSVDVKQPLLLKVNKPAHTSDSNTPEFK